MDCSNMTHVTAQTIPAPSFQSSISPLPTTSTPPPLSAVAPNAVLSPCAACKILRRRCDEKCILAPYFPPTEPHKFTISHRVFGASNIVKFLQEVPEGQRADAVSSMVYEARARIRDPVYGCAGAISQLQKQLSQLQAELAKAQAEIVTMQFQQAHLVALLCKEVTHSPLLPTTPFREQSPGSPYSLLTNHGSGFFDENNSGSLWEPLWI